MEGPVVLERRIPLDDLDPDAVKILQRLTRFDHSAYLVGGCVRDLLLGLKPKDFDIGTSATPRQVKRLFRNSRIIGRRFRLAHIYFRGGKIIEVATFRAREDDDNDDGDLMIRDDNQFGSPADDALRRDFTINQLFYDLQHGQVIDHAGGLADLDRRLVRTIGDPEVRFREDPIRILRAVKFAARLDLEIEERTLAALRRTREDIPRAAAPRILEEINRFCLGGRAQRSFELLFEHGVFGVILPEIEALYGKRAAARALLDAFLERLDRRTAEGVEPQTGEILALLVLPGLVERLGWSSDGKADPPRGLNPRDLADDVLRPLAVRLRVSRRDQETCRQLVMTLFRMVPHDRVRRGTLRSILRRSCFGTAVLLLHVLGERFGGAFASAAGFWSQKQPEPAPAERRKKTDDARDDETPEERPAKRRSRGRRGGRRRKRREAGGDEAPARERTADRRGGSSKPKAKPQPKPKPGRDGWDDDYFFSALPTVPELGDDGEPNRYGGVSTSTEADPAEDDARAEESESRRPRRRRRRRRSASTGSSNGDDQGSSRDDD